MGVLPGSPAAATGVIDLLAWLVLNQFQYGMHIQVGVSAKSDDWLVGTTHKGEGVQEILKTFMLDEEKHRKLPVNQPSVVAGR